MNAVLKVTPWDSFLGAIAVGTKLEEAMLKCKVTTADIETMCRLDDGGIQRQRWQDARLAGRRRKWTVFEFEDLFSRVAGGAKIDDAVMAVKGVTPQGCYFYEMINADPLLHAQYMAAKKAYSLKIGEDLFDIVDDQSRDTLAGKHGEQSNMAAVSRDKLRAETRIRYIASYNSKLFGEKKDQVNVQVNVNHAETLEAARDRAKQRDKRVTPTQIKNAVDAVFSEKPAAPAADDDKWMDDKPTDPQWREDDE